MHLLGWHQSTNSCTYAQVCRQHQCDLGALLASQVSCPPSVKAAETRQKVQAEKCKEDRCRHHISTQIHRASAQWQDQTGPTIYIACRLYQIIAITQWTCLNCARVHAHLSHVIFHDTTHHWPYCFLQHTCMSEHTPCYEHWSPTCSHRSQVAPLQHGLPQLHSAAWCYHGCQWCGAETPS